MKFKICFLFIFKRDKNVCSYVNLSILPETEKPLNGQGLTHIESSNAAALCALQYLSSKLQKNKEWDNFQKINHKERPYMLYIREIIFIYLLKCLCFFVVDVVVLLSFHLSYFHLHVLKKYIFYYYKLFKKTARFKIIFFQNF